ncbi:MAG: c-type cytochrome [Acetobacteraceae bacterium]
MFAQRAWYSPVALGVLLAFTAVPAGAQPKNLTQPPVLPNAKPAPAPTETAAPQPTVTKPIVVLPVSPPEGIPSLVPLGPPPGNTASELPMDMKNPVHGNPAAIALGRQLFKAMNCAGCHGYNAAGGMGPNLKDGSWTFGGTPVQIFKSIYEGRPEGMPAWGATLPAQEIWDMVAYIQSLGGTVPPSKFYQAMAGDKPGELTAPQEMATPSVPTKPAKSPTPAG